MNAKQRIMKYLKGAAYLLLIFLSAGWAYFFYLILVHGEIVCGEPNRFWLAIEFFLTIAVAFLGLALFIKSFKKN